jgi:hypothetical protein
MELILIVIYFRDFPLHFCAIEEVLIKKRLSSETGMDVSILQT